jgi:hypothetical protein
MLFLSTHLLVLSFQHSGDIEAMVLGNRRTRG